MTYGESTARVAAGSRPGCTDLLSLPGRLRTQPVTADPRDELWLRYSWGGDCALKHRRELLELRQRCGQQLARIGRGSSVQ